MRVEGVHAQRKRKTLAANYHAKNLQNWRALPIFVVRY